MRDNKTTLALATLGLLAVLLGGCVSSDDMDNVSFTLGEISGRMNGIKTAIESQQVVTQQGIDLKICDDLLTGITLEYPGQSSTKETLPYAVEGVINGYPEERGHFGHKAEYVSDNTRKLLDRLLAVAKRCETAKSFLPQP